jgi:pimeloyl-ACP methyl ester carboxylesterase
MESAIPTVVLVHGAWNGPWAWDEVRRYLDLARITSATVALPSVGETTRKPGGLADDVAAVSAVLDDLSGPFVLVGHSYSGVPVTEVAAAREDVIHVVYVSGFAIPPGTSMLDALGGPPPEWWVFAEDGETIMPGDPGGKLFSECAPAVANGAIAKLRPHSARSVREPLRAAGYGEKPATYVISERDAILPPHVQQQIAGLAQAATVSLDADHHPMLSRPAELALVLTGIVARTALAEPATS